MWVEVGHRLILLLIVVCKLMVTLGNVAILEQLQAQHSMNYTSRTQIPPSRSLDSTTASPGTDSDPQTDTEGLAVILR